jgi:hypothetical protein
VKKVYRIALIHGTFNERRIPVSPREDAMNKIDRANATLHPEETDHVPISF